MSEILVIFTLLILSPLELKLISERINVRTGVSEGKSEFFFKNTKSGFSLIGDKMSALKGNEPSRDCIINLSEQEGGFLGKSVDNSPKNLGKTKGLDSSALADLCKNAFVKK
ncbi:hypothetical protein JWG45_13510 [Leptospira sp. 201903070]|jgi:hypothetical protein|uniref:Uncharacterized protein n=1 Tax=Leptospira ainlahdjerensis TaxID=2810033 RepID=A0ABS2UDD2_9LEPT|nr:hypothetical protein [Leptospira ainlahdjerensis]MBM9578169.1 hypothetical protein [Leptospira ainlahdjerensis]